MLVLVLLGSAVLIGSVAVSIGAVTVPLGVVWRSVGHHLGIIGAVEDPIQDQIVWDLRVPPSLWHGSRGPVARLNTPWAQAVLATPGLTWGVRPYAGWRRPCSAP